jgi:hypothetical protein
MNPQRCIASRDPDRGRLIETRINLRGSALRHVRSPLTARNVMMGVRAYENLFQPVTRNLHTYQNGVELVLIGPSCGFAEAHHLILNYGRLLRVSTRPRCSLRSS